MSAHVKRRLAGVFALVAVTFGAATASANPGGLAGYTGKPTSFSPNGESCNQCHNGGTAPTVTVNGPTSLNAGQVGSYTMVVGTGARGSGGVAATDGVVLTPGSGFRDSFGEMVQTASQSGGGTFAFTMKAPAYGGTVRLWAVGMASNGSGTGGDRAAQATRDVTIVGPAAPADAGTGSNGGGADAGDDDGASDDGNDDSTTTAAARDGGAAASSASRASGDGENDGEGDGDSRAAGRSVGAVQQGSCAMAAAVSSSSSSPSHAWSSWTAAGLTCALLGLAFARGRRRRR